MIAHRRGEVIVTVPQSRRWWQVWRTRYFVIVMTTGEAVRFSNLFSAAVAASRKVK